VVGAVVEAVLAERFMEGRTDAGGAFQMAGMLPASRVRIWIGGKHDPFVAERIDVGIPGEGQVADAGVIRLLRGDELASRLDGWVGLFVARRGGRVLASAVSPWLPADRAGIQVGDVLVSIDGRDIAGFGPRAVAFLLRGPPKSSVALVVDAHDGGRRKLTLERVVR
jgi:S1-C subfamily serine protease